MPRSKFGDIYRDLKYKIESGEYPYQSLVPSENTLVAVYGCSRNTVRRALAGLIEAGYVQAIQGKGVRVLYRPAARTPFTLGRMESFCETARRCRTDYQTKVVHFSMTQTDGALAAASGFPPGADVYHVERVRIIDGRAMVLEVSYFLRSVVTTLTPEAAEQSIYAYLERELDIQIMTSKRTITVEHASPAEESGAVNRPKILSCTKEPLRPKQPGSFSFSVQGGPISARIRATEILPPLFGCRCPNLHRGSQPACKFGRLPLLHFGCFVRWTRLSCAVPFRQNFPSNRALGRASHTLAGKFPCMCPGRTYLPSGRDEEIDCFLGRGAVY